MKGLILGAIIMFIHTFCLYMSGVEKVNCLRLIVVVYKHVNLFTTSK